MVWTLCSAIVVGFTRNLIQTDLFIYIYNNDVAGIYLFTHNDNVAPKNKQNNKNMNYKTNLFLKHCLKNQ